MRSRKILRVTGFIILRAWMFKFLLLCFQAVLVSRLTVVCLIKDSLDVCKSWLLTDSRLVLYEVHSYITYRKAVMLLDELSPRAVKRVAFEIIFIQLSRKRTFNFRIEGVFLIALYYINFL